MVQKSADSIASSRAARLAGNRQREGWRRQKFPHRHAFGLFGRRLRESRVQAFKGLPGVGIAVSGGLPVPFPGLLDVHRDTGPLLVHPSQAILRTRQPLLGRCCFSDLG